MIAQSNKCGDNKGTILYIGGFELPDKNAAAHRVLNNAKLFRSLGYNTVFVGVDKRADALKEIEKTKKDIYGFISYSIPYPKSVKDWFIYIKDIDVFLPILNTISDVFAVIGYNYPAFAMDKMLRYCRKHNIFCFADITEWYGGEGRSLPMRIIKDVESHHRMYNTHKKLDGLIVISKYLEDFYKFNNVLRLPPLTDLTESKWVNEGEKNQETLHICYAGSPGTKDKINLLIAAIPLIKRNIRIDIIGITSEDYLKLHHEHEKILSSGKVVFHGRLSHVEALEYIKHANYSCFFREKNRVTMAGFPTKFSEAISSGTPVITNDSSDISEYVIDNENGILISDITAEAIADVIDSVKCNFRVNRNTFDYRQYTDSVKRWCERLLQIKEQSNV